MPKPHGRPSKYSPEIEHEICEGLGSGLSLTKVCEPDHMPHPFTVRRWMLGIGIPAEHASRFRENYGGARELQAEAHFDELYDDAEACDETPGAVSKYRLKADAVKWRLARMNRAKYGDKSEIDIGGQAAGVPVATNNSVDISHMTPDDQAALRKLARAAVTGKKDA